MGPQPRLVFPLTMSVQERANKAEITGHLLTLLPSSNKSSPFFSSLEACESQRPWLESVLGAQALKAGFFEKCAMEFPCPAVLYEGKSEALAAAWETLEG